MRQVFEVLRLAYDQGLSQRAVLRALGLAQATVNEYRRRFRGMALAWPIQPESGQAAVNARFYAHRQPPSAYDRANTVSIAAVSAGSPSVRDQTH